MSLIPVNGSFTVPVLPPGLPWVDIQETYGVMYIGVTISMCLLGSTTLQAWYYYNAFPNDALWMKVMVVALCGLEYARGAFMAHGVYYYVILNWGNPLGLEVVIWSFKTVIILTCFGELFVRIYFIWRIFALSRGRTLRSVLTVVTSFLTLWSLGVAFATFLSLAEAKSFSVYTNGSVTRILSPFAFATNIAADFAVTSSLVFLLHQNRTGYSRTNRLINTIILYLVQAGAMTIVADILCLAFGEYVTTLGLAYVGTYACVGNLYANSLLANLNARAALSKLRGGDAGGLSSLNAQSTQAQTAETHNLSSVKYTTTTSIGGEATTPTFDLRGDVPFASGKSLSD